MADDQFYPELFEQGKRRNRMGNLAWLVAGVIGLGLVIWMVDGWLSLFVALGITITTILLFEGMAEKYTRIQCPKCKSNNIYQHITDVPKYSSDFQHHCKDCGAHYYNAILVNN